ncbi:hypothetical protein Mgra_00009616 [Meloidogyne graminicola]|uniref:Uncharacterized protein n=1 Tax=Meloidogyne graminicola TaxID=189291 RepID=A0A8S9Z8X8_9BILA|nr:hypothetical protein Mgra_00009616 [Meloidogyne graminicola]
MVHIPFDTRTVGYDDYHVSINQIGEGIDEPIHYFRGIGPYQRGYGRQTGGGVGDVLRHFWRFLLPYAKRAGTAVAKEALATGGRILENVENAPDDKESSQINLKQAVINEGKRGIDRLLEQGGMSKQFGTGLYARKSTIKANKRKRQRHSSFSKENSHKLIIRNRPSLNQKRKRQKVDTFGLY